MPAALPARLRASHASHTHRPAYLPTTCEACQDARTLTASQFPGLYVVGSLAGLCRPQTHPVPPTRGWPRA